SANQDVAEAAARVEEARALAGLAQADRWPQIDLSASASRTRLSGDSALLPPGIPLETSRFRIAPTVSFDADFWGRLRRLSAAARAELLSSEEGRRHVRLGVVSEVAEAYFDLVALDRQLVIARETLDSRRESARLQRLRFQAGTISQLDLAQAEAEVAATEAAVPVLERQARQTEDLLAVLLGRMGGTVERNAALDGLVLPIVPLGLPSQLLSRRPDVVAAEQRLVAANARIGAARAAYFPSIVLTGAAGSESSALSNLLTSGTGIWQAALSLVQPIFNAGKTGRRVEAARARQRQELAAYTRTVQNAFADVEDALVARRTGAAEREALARQVSDLANARRLARLRYEAGNASYLEVLDAERNLFRAQLELTRARRGELAASVNLFRALGGGWEDGHAGSAQAPRAALAR
ncbi:MAG TPA: efflux transporter outer membrane subunit, partial [Vicinamibacteria bacterium]|nr:efflux transporter outer membrane subunit [Vicinamibacteria bacterium]